MALVKILKYYPNPDGWNEGDVVEITNPEQLLREGKVELYIEKPKAEPKKKATKKVKK